jgi:hypothetical protein
MKKKFFYLQHRSRLLNIYIDLFDEMKLEACAADLSVLCAYILKKTGNSK